MMNLVSRREDPWPERWRPVGEGEHQKESFDKWWERNQADFSNLHPDILRQWVYRHWKGSPLSFLDVSRLGWRAQSFTTNDLLTFVHAEWGVEPGDTERDYGIFRPDKEWPLQTALMWENGTWTIPIVVLATPDGVIAHDERYPNTRYLLVEGSKRYRWLAALNHRGEKTGPHQVFVLE